MADRHPRAVQRLTCYDGVMKLAGKIILAVIGINIAMFVALILPKPVDTPQPGTAELLNKTEHSDGSCSLLFDADGIELTVDETDPAECSSLEIGDVITY